MGKSYYICDYKKCCTISSFNYKNSLQPIYCKKHKLHDMINIRRRTCYVCDALATHNTIDNTLLYKLCGLYCEKHQLPNMVNIKDYKIMTNKKELQEELFYKVVVELYYKNQLK